MATMNLVISVVAGVLLGVAVSDPAWWWLGVLGVGLLTWLIGQPIRLRRLLVYTTVVGLVRMLIVLSWFWTTYPLTWLGLEQVWSQVAVITAYWVPTALVLGLGLMVFSYGVRRWLWSRSTFLLVVGAGVFWVIGELFGALLFSIFLLGPGSTISAQFGLGFLGYSLVSHPWVFAVFGWSGVYGLSWLGASLGVLVGWWACQLRWRAFGLLLGVFLITSLIPVPSGLLPTTVSDDNTRVAILATDFSFQDNTFPVGSEARQAVFLAALAAATEAEAEYVLFPEDSRFAAHYPSIEAAAAVVASTTADSVMLVDSARTGTATGDIVLRSFIIDTPNDAIHRLDKQYLVPQGEYVPYVYQVLMWLVNPTDTATEIMGNLTYRPGQFATSTGFPDHIPTVLFCFESIDPRGVAKRLHEHPKTPFVAHLVSHSWFTTPRLLWQQQDSMLRLQARSNRTVVIQASNEGPTAVYWPSGTVTVPPVIARGEGWRLHLATW